MARRKSEAKCPYCEKICAIAGLTSHVRSKHSDKYQEFQDNKAALIEKHRVVEGKPVSVEEVETVTTPEPGPTRVDKPDAPAPEQKSGSFLASVGKALRDW